MIQTYHTQLTRDLHLTPDVHQYTFELEQGQDLHFQPGQYLIMWAPQGDGSTVRKLYSIASPAYQKHSFDLIIKLVEGGKGSAFLKSLSVGSPVTFQGPAGIFTFRQNNRPKVFLATGTGIAPIRSMISTQLRHGVEQDYYLFWGLREQIDSFYHQEWEIVTQKYSNFHYMLCYSREQDPTTTCTVCQRIDTHLEMVLDDWKKSGRDCNAYDYYICGGKTATDGLLDILARSGVEKQNIFFERFV